MQTNERPTTGKMGDRYAYKGAWLLEFGPYTFGFDRLLEALEERKGVLTWVTEESVRVWKWDVDSYIPFDAHAFLSRMGEMLAPRG